MPIALKRLPDAVRDIAEAGLWHEDQEPGLGSRFYDEVEEVINSLPETALHHRKRFANVRRANLPTFPYAVFYEVKQQVVEIFAVLHGARHPRLARQRHRRRR
jgi:plasmid stabilization system protein ParE